MPGLGIRPEASAHSRDTGMVAATLCLGSYHTCKPNTFNGLVRSFLRSHDIQRSFTRAALAGNSNIERSNYVE
eukprot:scaffold6963_cov91-Cylindrotheca_fusiformis.AAC.2